MHHFSHRTRRIVVFAGLAVALLFGICGSCLPWPWAKAKPKASAPDLRALDRAAQPFFTAAAQNVPKVVRTLTQTRMLTRICWAMARDSVGGRRTADLLNEVLRDPIIEPCKKGAAVYGCGIRSEGLPSAVADTHRHHVTGAVFAAGGLALEALLMRSTIAALRSVLGATVARLSAAYGGGAACAAVDGPFPFGDAVGVALAAGGTAWCLHDLIHAGKLLRRDLAASLLAGIADCREACRREVLR